jgi:hypothetical protein
VRLSRLAAGPLYVHQLEAKRLDLIEKAVQRCLVKITTQHCAGGLDVDGKTGERLARRVPHRASDTHLVPGCRHGAPPAPAAS